MSQKKKIKKKQDRSFYDELEPKPKKKAAKKEKYRNTKQWLDDDLYEDFN